jgi:hypothetical protein
MFETLTYLAAEPGRHTLGDVTIEAGAATASADLRRVDYAAAFGSTPIVLHQVASEVDATAVATRLANVSTTGFQVRLQEQEANVRAGEQHAEETVHYIALSTGLGELDGQRLKVRRMGVITSHRWRRILFRAPYEDAGLIVAEQTSKGADTVVPRYRRLTDTTAEVKMQEEKSHDSEVAHAKERLGWVVIEAK